MLIKKSTVGQANTRNIKKVKDCLLLIKQKYP